MGLFDKLKAAFTRTTSTLSQEIRRIVTRSPKLTAENLEELEAALLRADLGLATTQQILAAARTAFETQGRAGIDFIEIAAREVERNLAGLDPTLGRQPSGLTIVSVVGVNGTGKTTTCAKLAHRAQLQGESAILAACDTFRAAAIEQLAVWGERNGVPVIAKPVGSDAAAVAFEALERAREQNIDVLMIDTAGRLQNKQGLMEELAKIVRVIRKADPAAPHDTLLVLDATTGQNAVQQVEVFLGVAQISGLIMTKLDGTARGGVLVACAEKFGLPIHAIGVGESIEDLQPFDAREFADTIAGVAA